MQTVLIVIHLMVVTALVIVVLLQRSEGGALGIGGGGNSLISGRGAADVLARATGFLALAFFITSISLTVLGGGVKKAGSVLDEPTHTPNFLESILPKKQPDVVAPPTAPAPRTALWPAPLKNRFRLRTKTPFPTGRGLVWPRAPRVLEAAQEVCGKLDQARQATSAQ